MIFTIRNRRGKIEKITGNLEIYYIQKTIQPLLKLIKFIGKGKGIPFQFSPKNGMSKGKITQFSVCVDHTANIGCHFVCIFSVTRYLVNYLHTEDS